MKKASYVVHAQFLIGIRIGIFSVCGHLLLDDESFSGKRTDFFSGEIPVDSNGHGQCTSQPA